MRLEIKDLSISYHPIANRGLLAAGDKENDDGDQCPKFSHDDDEQCPKFSHDDDEQCPKFSHEDDDDDSCCRMSMGQSVTTGDDDDNQGQSAAAHLSAHRAELYRLMGGQHVGH